jgi:anthranilate phosphoribosyltransferase
MTDFSKYVYAMGRGPSKGRNLTQDEATDAMLQILDGSVDLHAVGALLMLMRYRGETPAEIAGFVQALRARNQNWQNLSIDVDWPSYAAGRTRGLPWFLLAAKLISGAGHRVFLHGWNSNQTEIASVRNGVELLGIKKCSNPETCASILANDGIVYCPLDQIDNDAQNVLKLRNVLGLRSAINTALRGFNPTLAPLSVQGVFHPSYRNLQVEAATILQQQNMLVVKGGGGEFEINPSKDAELFVKKPAGKSTYILPAQLETGRRLAEASTGPTELQSVWDGTSQNLFAQKIVTATAATVLRELNPNMTPNAAVKQAENLWENRQMILEAGI